MRKLLVGLAISLVTLPALAQHHHHHGHWHYRGGHNPWVWIAPTIIGGVVGYEIARSQQPVIVQQPVIIPNNTVTVNQYCGPWIETQHADGSITRSRTCTQ